MKEQIAVYRAYTLGVYGEYFPTKAEAVANLVGLLAGNGIVEFGHPAYRDGRLNCCPEVAEVGFDVADVAADCVGGW